jgi:hypothetical protein
MDADFFRKHVRGLVSTLNTNLFEFPKRSISPKTRLSCPMANQWDDSVNDLPLYPTFLSTPDISLIFSVIAVGRCASVTHMDLSLRGRLTPPALRSTSAPENHRYHAMSKCLYKVYGFRHSKADPAFRWLMTWAPRRIQQSFRYLWWLGRLPFKLMVVNQRRS